MGLGTSLLIAFVGGLASFLSPCVLPLIPGYLSFMTGLSAGELSEGNDVRRTVAVAALFVAGFTVVFVALGATASVLGAFFRQYQDIIERVAGLFIIGFGVLMLGVIRIPWLYGEKRFSLEKSKSFGRGAAFVMGAAFAAGWTPCIGALLGSIIAIAASAGSVGRGSLLLAVYSLGLGVPFMLVAVAFGRLRGMMGWLNRHSLVVNRVAAVFLIAFGLLMLTGRMSVFTGWFSSIPGLEVGLPSIR